MSVKKLYLAFALAIMACAAAGTSGTRARSSSLIGADDIAVVNPQGKTAFDLVSRLRPKWLIARGAQAFMPQDNVDSTEYALVFVDGNPVGKLGALEDIQAGDVEDIRFYDVAEAGARFGTRGGRSGVIEVRTKVRTRQ